MWFINCDNGSEIDGYVSIFRTRTLEFVQMMHGLGVGVRILMRYSEEKKVESWETSEIKVVFLQ